MNLMKLICFDHSECLTCILHNKKPTKKSIAFNEIPPPYSPVNSKRLTVLEVTLLSFLLNMQRFCLHSVLLIEIYWASFTNIF